MLPKLPENPKDQWKCSFIGDVNKPLHTVSAAGGLVVAGGDILFMQRPGKNKGRMSLGPPTVGLTHVVAEPWPPHRYVVAAKTHFGVFEGDKPVPAAHIEFTNPEHYPTHICWARVGKESTVYFRQRGGQMGRVRLAEAKVENFNVVEIDAITSDHTGTVAVLDIGAANLTLLHPDGSREDRELFTIPESTTDNPDLLYYMAMADGSVAFCTEDSASIDVSWHDQPERMEHARQAMSGPIAFADKDHLFAVYNHAVEGPHIVRTSRLGEPELVGVIEVDSHNLPDDEEMPAVAIASIAWDSTRNRLWAVSPQFGLTIAEPPKSAKVKKVVYS
jgi:hypothetical protein